MTYTNETSPLLHGSQEKKRVGGRRYKIALGTGVVLALCGFAVCFFGRFLMLGSYNASFPSLLQPLKLTVYTNNIRFDNNYNDPLEKKWKHRRHPVVSSIDFNTRAGDANVVCLQEVLHNQLEDILSSLNDDDTTQEWTYFGVGRSDGLTRGEYAPILFKDSEWYVLDNQTFWLSDTPLTPSRGWDAALERIVTMVTVQSKKNPSVILNFFNTHFDHRGREARKRSAELIIKKMNNHNRYPSFLCGDFNTEPRDTPYHKLKSAGFKDSRVLVDERHYYGHHSTFTGFDKENEAKSIIDYIWSPYFTTSRSSPERSSEVLEQESGGSSAHQNFKIQIESFGILHNFFHGFYFSDHRPVVADYTVWPTIF